MALSPASTVLAVLTALACADGDEPESPRVAGLAGFTAISEVVFTGRPDLHRFEATYLFPDRCRLALSVGPPGQAVRFSEYRRGDDLYRVPAGATASERCAGADRDAVLRRMELRRATMLWPDGFDWTVDETGARAPIRGVGEDPAGAVAATGGSAERPARFTALDAEGAEQESLVVVAWSERAGRTWPHELRVEVGGAVVWTETMELVDTRRQYLDLFFLPVDRREPAAVGVEAGSGVAHQEELPLLRVRRLPLPDGTSWEAAEALAAGHLREEGRRLGEDFALDPVARFEIDSGGAPVVLLLALAADSRTAEGYEPLAGRTGLSLVLDGVDRLGRSSVRELLAAVPEGARPTPAYVRRSGSRIQVVLPLVPVE